MPKCAECEHILTMGAFGFGLCRKQGNKEVGLYMDVGKCPHFSKLDHIISADTRHRGMEIGARPPEFADEVKKSDVNVESDKVKNPKQWG